MLTFMSMQQAPMKKPTLWATIVLISRKMSIPAGPEESESVPGNPAG